MIFKNIGDEYSNNLGESAKDILIRMGSPVSAFGYTSSLAIATRKEDDSTYCTVASAYNGRYQGPTQIVVTVDMFRNSGCY